MSDEFDLGQWAGTAQRTMATAYAEDTSGPDEAWLAVETLRNLINDLRTRRDIEALEVVRRHWETAEEYIATCRISPLREVGTFE